MNLRGDVRFLAMPGDWWGKCGGSSHPPHGCRNSLEHRLLLEEAEAFLSSACRERDHAC